MLKKIEYLLPAAMAAVPAKLEENGIVLSGYQSAISAFGVSVMQMGLLPTFAVYVDKGSDADISREKLLAALQHILSSAESRYSRKAQLGQMPDLLKEALAVRTNPNTLRELQEHTLQAAVALKLAIRTFKLD